MNEGTLISDANGTRLVFERLLLHPRATVWQAIADPDRRGRWFSSGTLDLTAGGRVDLHDSGPGITGTVTRVRPEELLEFFWSSQDGPDSSVRFELSDVPEGTKLVFTHHVTHGCNLANLLPGWHCIFDDLPQYLDSGTVHDSPDRFTSLKTRYTAVVEGTSL